ncbi:tRNA lysidine(34) synthetase TilS [candidate division KSB1 bacterium]|nr:tRNA lysidine(34) synthetase TilS [candidate division KSB1 bacterium]
MDLLQQFRQHCASHRLVQPDDRLLLAVSGGLDSRVMLDLFCRLREQWQVQKQGQLQLAVAHVNHQMRGSESDEDEAFVKALAQAANLPFYSQRIDVPRYAQTHKLSLESAARELRYEALEEFRQNWQGRAIMTAHTLDDQAETILDHLLRGSGLAGLAGMAALTDIQLGFHHEKFVMAPSPPCILKTNERRSGAGAVLSSKSEPLEGKLQTGQLQTTVLRPLLPFSRQQLEAYGRYRELSWREDRTNVDQKFRRNRIRHELVPLLKTRFNPQIARSLERLATIAGAADDYFHTEAETALSKVIKETQPDKIILDIEQFWKYFEIVQRYVIRAVIQRLMNAQVEPTFSETARILALTQRSDVSSRNFAKTTLGRRFIWRLQIEVSVDHDGVVFRRLESVERGAKSGKRKAAERTDALRSTLYASRSIIPVKIGERCPIPEAAMALLVERKGLPPDWRQQVHPYSQFVDAEKVAGNLIVRFPQPGDRFMPLRGSAAAGSIGSKKLSDFFTDLKVPLHRRRVIPILECGDIVWVCGYRLDDRFKITPATREVLHLRLLSSDDQSLTV